MQFSVIMTFLIYKTLAVMCFLLIYLLPLIDSYCPILRWGVSWLIINVCMGEHVGTRGTSAMYFLSLYVQCDTIVGGWGILFWTGQRADSTPQELFFKKNLFLWTILNIYKRKNSIMSHYIPTTQLWQLSPHSLSLLYSLPHIIKKEIPDIIAFTSQFWTSF